MHSKPIYLVDNKPQIKHIIPSKLVATMPSARFLKCCTNELTINGWLRPFNYPLRVTVLLIATYLVLEVFRTIFAYRFYIVKLYSTWMLIRQPEADIIEQFNKIVEGGFSDSGIYIWIREVVDLNWDVLNSNGNSMFVAINVIVAEFTSGSFIICCIESLSGNLYWQKVLF